MKNSKEEIVREFRFAFLYKKWSNQGHEWVIKEQPFVNVEGWLVNALGRVRRETLQEVEGLIYNDTDGVHTVVTTRIDIDKFNKLRGVKNDT